jgi:hypothetical protein
VNQDVYRGNSRLLSATSKDQTKILLPQVICLGEFIKRPECLAMGLVRPEYSARKSHNAGMEKEESETNTEGPV